MNILFMGGVKFSVETLKSFVSEMQINNDDTIKIQNVFIKSVSNKEDSNVRFLLNSLNAKIFEIKKFTKENIALTEQLNPDLIIVAAYGVILPSSILNIPKYGCINVHPSAVPRWRGAAPLQRSIMHNDSTTNVCILKMTPQLDDGNILEQEKDIPILENTTYYDLLYQTAEIGGKLLYKAVKNISSKQDYVGIPQSDNIAITYADKITIKEKKIDWDNEAITIHKLVMSISPVPSAFFRYSFGSIKNIQIKLIETRVVALFQYKKEFLKNIQNKNIQIGEIFQCNLYNYLLDEYKINKISQQSVCVRCQNDTVLILELVQKENSKVMKGLDMINGMRNLHYSIIKI